MSRCFQSSVANSVTERDDFALDVPKSVPQRLKSLRENSPLCRPFGTRFAEILPGTPVPGYRLSRPFGTDCVGRPAVLSSPFKGYTLQIKRGFSQPVKAWKKNKGADAHC